MLSSLSWPLWSETFWSLHAVLWPVLACLGSHSRGIELGIWVPAIGYLEFGSDFTE